MQVIATERASALRRLSTAKPYRRHQVLTPPARPPRRCRVRPPASSAGHRTRAAVPSAFGRIVSTRADADDVLAMTFLEVWRRRTDVRIVEGSLLPWLLVTAANVARNVERSRSRHRRFLQTLPSVSASVDHAEVVGDGSAVMAFRRLRPADQQVLALCVLNDLTLAEAAEVLHVPVGTVKSRLSRARRRLAAHHQESGPVGHVVEEKR